MRRFSVIIPKNDGGVEVHPMKEWLRQHPDNIPSGMDTKENTSYQLRNGLKKMGWKVQETGTVEYPTAVGRIDILAVDEKEAFYVFELKRGRESDKVVGQVTRYMGWVSDTIGKGKEVNGVIVAKSIDKKLRYSASVVPRVYLFEYQVEFHLKEANTING